MPGARFRIGGALLLAATLAGSTSCRRDSSAQADAGARVVSSAERPTGDDGVTPRPGMAWIAPGRFRAGTPPGRAPRIADEELPGTSVEMGGFYIDLLPWPNESNAIPTSNVSRDEAEQLCATKGKRLCSELEWERACKGPADSTYEYGDAYRRDVCGTGVALEQASRRPTGEHAQCKSGFGVSEMHGGVWEWTSSSWGRGSRDPALGVLRGGNSLAGELVGRCANAIARVPSKKSPTMGFRCCAGPKNGAEVTLELKGVPGLAVASGAAAPLGAILASTAKGSEIAPKTLHAFSWVPVANEELVIALGCSVEKECALVIARPAADAGAGEVLGAVSTGREIAEVVRNGDARHLRMRSLDPRGVYLRDITYAYGRVEMGEPKRP